MTFTFDPEAQAVYIRVRDGIVAKTVEPEPELFVDLDENGRILGLELLNPVGREDLFAKLAREYAEPALELIDPLKIHRIMARP